MNLERPILIGRRSLARAVHCVSLLLLCPSALLAQQRTEDPVPIQRIELPVERIPAEMENVHRNVLKQMPQSEFENLVQQAANARDAERDPPKLVEARYRAVLEGDGLVGSAEWRILHRAPGPGRLSLQALQLALRKARWPDSRPARLGFFEDRPNAPLELWIEKAGEHALTLDWSARGVPQPGGWRFDLRVPASPLLTLELDLPAANALIADGDGIRLSGPFPAEKPDRSVWHISQAGVPTTGQTQLPFLVLRPLEAGQPGPLVRYAVTATQKILPGEVDCDFDLDLNVSRGGMRALTVELDAGLKPRDVFIPNLESWEPQRGTAGKTQLLIRVREPLAGGKATIRAVAALPPADAPWVSPGVRVVGGIARGESLQVRIHPSWQLEDWKAGRFRLTNVQTAGDQFQILTLQESGLETENTVRPEAKLRAAGAVFDLRQNLDWRIEPDTMTLTVQLVCEVRRGQIFDLPVIFSAPWEFEQVESTAAEGPVRGRVQLKSGPGQNTLHLEFNRPLTARGGKSNDGEPGTFTVTLHFRAPGPRWANPAEAAAAVVPFPQIQVLGARQRDGKLALRLHPTLVGSAATDAPATAWSGLRIASEPILARPDFYYSFQGQSPEGTLQLRQRRSRYQARCDTKVTIVGGQWELTHRLEIIPRAGALRELLLSFSTPPPGPWKAQVVGHRAEVQLVAPFPVGVISQFFSAMGASSIWDALVGVSVPRSEQGAWWRVVLDRPVQETVQLELACSGQVEDRVDLPLLLSSGADIFEGRVHLQTSPARHWDVAPVRLQEGQVDSQPHESVSASWPQREFQYRLGPVGLSLRLAGAGAVHARCEDATLYLQLRSNRVLAAFSFSVNGWEEATLPITLPDGVKVISARLNGQDILASATSPNGDTQFIFPWMPFRAWNRGEIIYELPVSLHRLWSKLEIPAPRLSFGIGIVHRYWDLADDLVPWNGNTEWQPVRKEYVAIPPAFAEARHLWEARPERQPDSIVVVHTLSVRGLGWLLAGLVVAFAIAGRGRSGRWRNSCLLAVFVAAGWAWIWLPSGLQEMALWPGLASGGILLIAVIRWGATRRPRITTAKSVISRSGSALASSLLAVILLTFTGESAPPAPTPVYLLPGSPDDSTPRTVLAPPELIEQLQALARHAAPASRALLLEARYVGRIAGDGVTFDAHFQIHCWSDEKAVVHLPLSGIQLQQALLDGAVAWPRSAGADRLAFEVKGNGSHALTLRFFVPASGATEREARFGIPELPISKLTVSAAADVTQLQVLSWKGAQRLQLEPEPKLEADLGRIQSVQLLWQTPSPAAKPTPIPVQEVHLWDLSETAGRLQSVFRYSLGSQSISQLEFEVPAELEVVQAGVRALDNRIASPGLPGLKDWRWEGTGANRRLQLQLPFPLTGQVQLNLELLPRNALGRNPVLAVPVAAGLVDRQTFLAYRLQG
ncbi:MAG TPA: hypothetical protein VGZ47_00005, partial [Gemmataceae bacterium]|nr:hypothetical protein [Gemmataceae bacterium]